MFDKEYAKNQKTRNKEYIEKLTAKLLRYYSDDNREGRRARGLCKCCAYVRTDKIGGAAITKCNCENCGCEMVFGSTCIDKLCNDCAVEIGHCKDCGQKLD